MFKQRLKCFFWQHDWTKWKRSPGQDKVRKDMWGSFLTQERKCKKCGKIQITGVSK